MDLNAGWSGGEGAHGNTALPVPKDRTGSGPMKVLAQRRLAPFLRRHMQMAPRENDLKFGAFLKNTLAKANAFVPSEAGAIFLDDPKEKWGQDRVAKTLSTVACFGTRADRRLGETVDAGVGVIGRVYRTGKACFAPEIGNDSSFSEDVDLSRLFDRQAKSVICVPIRIRSSMIGVLQLVNRKRGAVYSAADFELIKIFADYISASIQNFLDAKRNAENANRDHLTGLANDRALYARLKRELARLCMKNLALLFIDLDRFKSINDEYGHLTGSRIIAEIGQALRKAISTPNAEIARYGGDEYVVVLPAMELAEALKLAERIRRLIARTAFPASPQKNQLGEKLLRPGHVTVSIGLACVHEHVGRPDADQLLKAADDAMYAAKKRGRNKISIAVPLARKPFPHGPTVKSARLGRPLFRRESIAKQG